MEFKFCAKDQVTWYKTLYGALMERWINESDDRKVAAILYQDIISAYEAIDGIENSFVIVAVDQRVAETKRTIEKIIEHFNNR